MLKRSLIAGVVAIVCGVLSTHAQQAGRPARTAPAAAAPQGATAPAGTRKVTPTAAPARAAGGSGGHRLGRRSEGVHQPVLHRLSQRAGQGRGHGLGAQAGARRARPGQPGARREDVGAGGPQAPRGHDAAGGHEAAGTGHLRRDDQLVRAGARRRGGALHAGAGPAPAESHRIRQRRPRSAGPSDIDAAKYLPSDDSTSGFDNIAGALGLSSTLVEAYVVGGAEDQPPRAGLSRAADAGGVPHARRHVAGLPPGRHAVRHARRPRGAAPLPVRRRVPDDGDADLRRQHVADRLRLGAVRAHRDAARRRAPVARGLGGRRPSGGGQLRAGPQRAAPHRRSAVRPGPKRSSAAGAARRCACASRPRPARTTWGPRSSPPTSRRCSTSTSTSCATRCRRARRPATRSSRTSAPSASRARSRPRRRSTRRAGAGSSCARRRRRPKKPPARAASSRAWPPAPSAVPPPPPTWTA